MNLSKAQELLKQYGATDDTNQLTELLAKKKTVDKNGARSKLLRFLKIDGPRLRSKELELTRDLFMSPSTAQIITNAVKLKSKEEIISELQRLNALEVELSSDVSALYLPFICSINASKLSILRRASQSPAKLFIPTRILTAAEYLNYTAGLRLIGEQAKTILSTIESRANQVPLYPAFFLCCNWLNSFPNVDSMLCGQSADPTIAPLASGVSRACEYTVSQVLTYNIALTLRRYVRFAMGTRGSSQVEGLKEALSIYTLVFQKVPCLKGCTASFKALTLALLDNHRWGTSVANTMEAFQSELLHVASVFSGDSVSTDEDTILSSNTVFDNDYNRRCANATVKQESNLSARSATSSQLAGKTPISDNLFRSTTNLVCGRSTDNVQRNLEIAAAAAKNRAIKDSNRMQLERKISREKRQDAAQSKNLCAYRRTIVELRERIDQSNKTKKLAEREKVFAEEQLRIELANRTAERIKPVVECSTERVLSLTEAQRQRCDANSKRVKMLKSINDERIFHAGVSIDGESVYPAGSNGFTADPQTSNPSYFATAAIAEMGLLHTNAARMALASLRTVEVEQRFMPYAIRDDVFRLFAFQ